jgi:peptidoglycan/xylan/chitin deacetylase (PgdA/CDA1 family)
MKKTMLALSLFALFGLKATAQTPTTWKGKGCAVVLTYDDGLNVHLTNAIPALDSFGLKGTFYISDYAAQLNKQIPGWRKAAAKGHELANHTIWHACEGGRSGREFVKGDYDLRYYTVRRAIDEARGMNNILKAIDGKDGRTFAFPCGDTKIHDTAYIEDMQGDFVAARGVHGDMPTIDNVKLFDLPCYMINGQSGAELIALVNQAMKNHTLLIFLFHGVGGEHNLNVSLPAHRQLLQYLKANQKKIWIAPMINVAEYVKKRGAKQP